MSRKALEPAVSRADEQRLKEQTAVVLREQALAQESMTFASSPTNNMGGKSQKPDFERYEQLVLGADGQPRIQMLRRAVSPDQAFIDQISFTFDESACVDWAKQRKHVHELLDIANQAFIADTDYIRTISALCHEIFGFGISESCPRGMNFYKKTWKLGTDDALYGHVSFGGQRETVLVQVTGTGAMAAHDGWEQRLHQYLSAAPRAKITRVDLARDFLNGEYTVDMANTAYDDGEFCSGGRWPSIEQHGNWKRPDGAGRTLYLGKRKSGKFTRIYEKGRQLGDKESPWTRLEVEFKSIDRIVPFDVLLYPGQYLAAAYPALDFLSEAPKRIETQVKQIELTYDKAVHYARLQVGRLLNFMTDQASLTATEVVELLRRPKAGYPKRLKLELISADFCTAPQLHEQTYLPDWQAHFMNGNPLAV